MKSKKWLAAGLSAGLLLSLLSGCGSRDSTQATASPSATPTAEAKQTPAGGNTADQEKNSTVQGIVTAIDGDTITVQAMGMGPGGGAAPQETPEQDSVPSQVPEATFSGADQSTGATEDAQAPQGGMPQGQSGDSQSAPTGEEITITLTADTKISVMNNGTATEGTAEDITVGSMLRITYGEDGKTVAEVTVSTAAAGAPQEQQQK